ncbi:MAG: AICAR transformylase/IMP cyclohydrolase PurH, partial [Mariniblastus sp.]
MAQASSNARAVCKGLAKKLSQQEVRKEHVFGTIGEGPESNASVLTKELATVGRVIGQRNRIESIVSKEAERGVQAWRDFHFVFKVGRIESQDFNVGLISDSTK